MVLQFRLEFFRGGIPFGKHYRRFYHHAPIGIGNAGNGAFQYRRMFQQGAFNLKGANTVAGAFYNVIGTADKPKIAIFIFPCDIACIVNIVVLHTAGEGIVPVIAVEHSPGFALVRANDYLSFLAHAAGGTIVRDNINVVTGCRLSH